MTQRRRGRPWRSSERASVASRWGSSSRTPATTSRSSIVGDGFGGTWRNNTYPGAACDVPSHFYSYSFALNPRWSKTFANQPEILAYLEKVAGEYGLERHLVAQLARHRIALGRRHRNGGRSATADGATDEFDAVVTRGRDARRSQHPRDSRSGPIPWPYVSLVGLGSLQIDCGRTRRVDRHGCQRHPIRAGDRRRCRAPDGVSAHADLGQPALRRTVHPGAARALRERPRRGPQSPRRGLPGLRVRQFRCRFRDDARTHRHGPRAI